MADSDHGRMALVREPSAIAALPHDRHGRPIPWFVAVNALGVPDFRVAKPGATKEALLMNLCWICGTGRGSDSAFVVGPMATINRVSPEPPSHTACARYAADACPFLSTPQMRRRETGLPDNRIPVPGVSVPHNPGVACVWVAESWEWRIVDNELLFDLGPALHTSWRTRGRAAGRAEVLAAMDKSHAALMQYAETEGPASVEELRMLLRAALRFVPPF